MKGALLSGPRKDRAAAGTSGRPEPVGAQPSIVTWTTPPTGAASGQTVIDPPACPPPPGATGEDAHPAVVDTGADVAGSTVDDGATARPVDWSVAFCRLGSWGWFPMLG